MEIQKINRDEGPSSRSWLGFLIVLTLFVCFMGTFIYWAKQEAKLVRAAELAEMDRHRAWCEKNGGYFVRDRDECELPKAQN